MKILISGHHISIGDSLKAHIEEHIEKHVKKYFEHAVDAHVVLTKEKTHIIKSEIMVNQGTGLKIIIKSSAEDDDAYRSFDLALQKAETQLRKYKSRIKNHHKDKEKRNAFLEAKKYVLAPFPDKEAGHEMGAPTIIAEKMADIEKLSVSDAVMHMDLLELPTYAFINSANNRLNIVYYRKDGNIAWLDLPGSNE